MAEMSIDDVVFDRSIYPRSSWSTSTVDQYVEDLENGDIFPPIVVEIKTNRLLDGKHRLESYKKAGRKTIEVTRREIPKDTTIELFALSFSTKHGDRISYDDRKAVVRKTVELNPHFDLAVIARDAGIARQTVSKWASDIIEEQRKIEEKKRELRKVRAFLLSKAGWSQRKIAEKLGVSVSTAFGDVNTNVTEQYTEDQLWEAGVDLDGVIDVNAIIQGIITERLEHIILAFSPIIAKGNINLKNAAELIEKYKAYNGDPIDRQAIAEDFKASARKWTMLAESIENPESTVLTDSDIHSLLEG